MRRLAFPDAPLFFQRGYGKQIVCMASSVHSRSVTGAFQKCDANAFSSAHQATLKALFGTLDKPIAVIGIILPARA
jgi:hypothetical protein